MAVLMLYWRGCLVLVREGGCEGEKVVAAKKCGYTIAARRRGQRRRVVFDPAEPPNSPHPSRE